MRAGSAVEREQTLRPAVIAWRAGHAAIAVGFLISIAYIWLCAISGRRGPLLRLAIGALAAEGALVAANHGDCPLGSLGDRVGDPVPLFDLVLPAAAARRAVPVLGAVAGAGVALLAIRSASRRPPRPRGCSSRGRGRAGAASTGPEA